MARGCAVTQAEAVRKSERGGLSWLLVHWLSFLRYSVLMVSAWFALSGLLPFAPYTIHGYRAVPSEGCASEVVSVYLMRTAKRPTLGWINRMDLDIRWQNIKTGETLVAMTPKDVFNGHYGYDEHALGLLNIAPDRPGKWRILTMAKVGGVKLLMPNEQITAHATEQVFSVLPPDHPQCTGSADG
jgi:hypothetical protein